MRQIAFLLALFVPLLWVGCASTDDDDSGDTPWVEPAAPEPTPAPESAPQPFSQADLEAMVAEILAIAPQNEHYNYPPAIRMRETDDDGNDVVNAWAGVEKRDDGLYTFVEMFRGLANLAKDDHRLIRAVLAHEIAHVSLGHALEGSQLHDVEHHHTRQEERAADEVGAQYLEQLGHSRQDMVDMLLMLDRHSKDTHVGWLGMVASDHASPVMRAAYLAQDDALLRAVSRFEIGLAYMECRRYEGALAFFDEALAIQDALHEAKLDAASAALQNYYDRLPAAVQDAWLRPEFGPHLTDALRLVGRATEITDEDVQRYHAALGRLEECDGNWYGTMHKFLWGTAHILNPRDDMSSVRAGVEALQSILGNDAPAEGWDYPTMRLGVVNNIAVGLMRLGEGERAARLLTDEQAADMRYVATLAENLTRIPLAALSERQAATVFDVLRHYVRWTPPDVPGARAAERLVKNLASKHGFHAPDVSERVPLAFCAVASMFIDEREVGLFDSYTDVSQIIGQNKDYGVINQRYPQLEFIYWGNQEVIALLESDAIVKLTSYRPGSYLVLRPERRTSATETFQIRVGMSEADFEKVLAPAGTDESLNRQMYALLDRTLFPATDGSQRPGEVWRYYPGLNFGVVIVDGVVAGISVTPAK